MLTDRMAVWLSWGHLRVLLVPPKPSMDPQDAQPHGEGWEIPKGSTAAVPVQGCAAHSQRMPPEALSKGPSPRSLTATLHLGDWGALVRTAGRVVKAATRQENSWEMA